MDIKLLAQSLTDVEIRQLVAHHLLQQHVRGHEALAKESDGEEKADHLAALSDKSIMFEQVQTVFNDSFSDRVVGLVAYLSSQYVKMKK